MKSVFQSISELRTTTTNHHRLLLFNLRSHYATKSTKPLKPSDLSEPKPITVSTSPNSPPLPWTRFSLQSTTAVAVAVSGRLGQARLDSVPGEGGQLRRPHRLRPVSGSIPLHPRWLLLGLYSYHPDNWS
ncbi:hypothetical protein TIFTF001_045182 [Ficus carica]|uniref:Uncharacterized protein n=1 Tax=Ficus carica TaxID=3494 RepID=A0AA87YPE2_FICCA|nr:hypothetical protein TIFTF001_045182 [Ficus carica]